MSIKHRLWMTIWLKINVFKMGIFVKRSSEDGLYWLHLNQVVSLKLL